MKSFDLNRIVLLVLFVATTSCVKDEITLPSIECNQPDLVVTKSVEEIRNTSRSLVAPYKFNDVIEAYVVSTDEFGNFFKTISFQTLATTTHPAIGFSVPIDVNNTYIDFRLGSKVYVKLQDQYTDLFYGGLRIGSLFVNSFNEGGVGRLSQNHYKKVLHVSCTTLKESALSLGYVSSEEFDQWVIPSDMI
jgi:hypothetical protein